MLAAIALPPLAALVATAWVSARRLLVPSLAALVLFGLAALLTGRVVHLAFASLALAACVVDGGVHVPLVTSSRGRGATTSR